MKITKKKHANKHLFFVLIYIFHHFIHILQNPKFELMATYSLITVISSHSLHLYLSKSMGPWNWSVNTHILSWDKTALQIWSQIIEKNLNFVLNSQ